MHLANSASRAGHLRFFGLYWAVLSLGPLLLVQSFVVQHLLAHSTFER